MEHFLYVAGPLALLWVCATVPILGRGHGSPPSLSQFPFLTVWNAPTARCGSRYAVDLDLSVFDIVQNQNQTFMGDNITIFYENQLGLYPCYSARGEALNGGIPQNASLSRHLGAVERDLRACIPDRAFRGLAVVDWESWRPLWERNWDAKRVYREGSRRLVRAKHPDWSPGQVEQAASAEFQEAGRAFMEETLKTGRRERPGGMWGFYGFPGCYNYQYKNATANYTGECPPQEVKRNDELLWLWRASSALYPDVYLELGLRGRGGDVLRYARHRVLEAMRVRARAAPASPPVLPYARIAYTYSLEFLSLEDLVHTIGESAALGSAGVVLWGDESYTKSKGACEAVKAYLDGTLGRYLVNVTTAAWLCSRTLCSARGRCQRRDPGSGAYLHLDPDAWTLVPRPRRPGRHAGGPPYTVERKQGPLEDGGVAALFECQCFPGWVGERCTKPLGS